MATEYPKQFFGSDGQSAIFASAADVPAGWQDHPGYYDKQRGVWVSQDTPNPGDIRTAEQRAADIAAEEVRHPEPVERRSGLNWDFDGNGTPLGRPLDAGAAAAERSRIVEGKPLTDVQEAERARSPDGRALRDGDYVADYLAAGSHVFRGGQLGEPPALAGMNKAELRAQAKAEDVAVEDDATNAELRAAIEKARKAK